MKSILEMSPDELLYEVEHFRQERIKIRQEQISRKRAESNGDLKKSKAEPKKKNDIEMDDILKDFLS